MHSFAQVHALSIDLCKNHHRKLPVTCACRFGQVRALSHRRACPRGACGMGGQEHENWRDGTRFLETLPFWRNGLETGQGSLLEGSGHPEISALGLCISNSPQIAS